MIPNLSLIQISFKYFNTIKVIIILALTLMSTSINATSINQSHWQLHKKQDGIIVYTKKIKGSDFLSFKAETQLNHSKNQIISILTDTGLYTKLFAYTHRAIFLNNSNTKLNPLKKDQQVYIETNLPWPFYNEDMIYNIHFDHKKNITTIYFEGQPDIVPKKTSINRMQSAYGYFILKEQANQTLITYISHSEPTGKIPTWLANKNIHNFPIKTLKNLKKLINK